MLLAVTPDLFDRALHTITNCYELFNLIDAP
jgi:hypothetical protein